MRAILAENFTFLGGGPPRSPGIGSMGGGLHPVYTDPLFKQVEGGVPGARTCARHANLTGSASRTAPTDMHLFYRRCTVPVLRNYKPVENGVRAHPHPLQVSYV